MMKYTNPQHLRKVGIKTPQTVIYKSESQKLHQAFPVKKEGNVAKLIVPGMPVKLNEDGTIEAYVGEGIYLGMAVTGSEFPCYPEGALGPEVTVMVEAFALTYGVANAEITKCGAIKPVALVKSEENEFYTPYAVDETSTDPKFICITPSAAKGDLIQVLIR